MKKFLATGCDILGACIFNGNIIFAVFFERGDLTKSKIIVKFVLGLVGLLNDKVRTTVRRNKERDSKTTSVRVNFYS